MRKHLRRSEYQRGPPPKRIAAPTGSLLRTFHGMSTHGPRPEGTAGLGFSAIVRHSARPVRCGFREPKFTQLSVACLAGFWGAIRRFSHIAFETNPSVRGLTKMDLTTQYRGFCRAFLDHPTPGLGALIWYNTSMQFGYRSSPLVFRGTDSQKAFSVVFSFDTAW